MSHKLLFESWRKYLTEQALNFPDEDEEEFDIYKLLNIDSITGEEFVDDVGKNSKEPVDNEFDINNAPFKKFNRTPRKKEDITALLIHESDGKGPIERLVQGLNGREGGLSVNHAVTLEGEVHELIPGEYETYHAPGWNRVSIGIEVHHHLGTKKFEGQKPISGPWTLGKPYYMPTVEQLEATYQLCLQLCREYGIPLRVSNVLDDKFDMEMPYEVLKGEFLRYPKNHEKAGQVRTYQKGSLKGKKIPKTKALPKLKVGVNKGIVAHGACQGNRSDGLVPSYYMALRLRGLAPDDALKKAEKDFNKNKKTIRHRKDSQISLPALKMGPGYEDVTNQLFHDPRVSDFIDE
ncbi:MAG: hypothetical protein CBD16_03730 [Betaproteobacteria bacterium TMED156]|nr:MAG: hypothetical protein CBD16_10210 [Betaproteobacteria bacterium TMED156]OUW02992.1 MAG: hypothetical protein CBD16_03730 [Betaproteobacteria bacterium TMED156]